jgi:hypothetical protein
MFVGITAMMHSHLTQWIEEADARQFCLAASWSRVPAPTERQCLHLGETILKVPARIGNYALACARRAAFVSRDLSAS